MVRILLAAAVISFITSYLGILLISGEEDDSHLPPWIEPCVILTILVLNACVGIYQDSNAEKAIEALKSL